MSAWRNKQLQLKCMRPMSTDALRTHAHSAESVRVGYEVLDELPAGAVISLLKGMSANVGAHACMFLRACMFAMCSDHVRMYVCLFMRHAIISACLFAL